MKRIQRSYENKVDGILTDLYNNAPEMEIKEKSPLIIFSDLHIGNGRKSDDFKKNSKLLMSALQNYYLPGNHTLVLNGDIEELQKFGINSIKKRWQSLYDIFDTFHSEKRLVKITGNHDYQFSTGLAEKHYDEKTAVKFITPGQGNPIFVFHGHQASLYYQYLNALNTFLLRFIVNPIGIKNFSKKLKHEKKMRIENRAYGFSRYNNLISIIGHTHRPLFESLSRADSLRFSIENLLRSYRKAETVERAAISAQIKRQKKQFDKYAAEPSDYEPVPLLYSNGIPVPCLFNTGCTIGKRGITGIEITTEKISLVHWFDQGISSRFLFDSDLNPKPLPENPSIYRVVLREDRLDYIKDSINLLGGSSIPEYRTGSREVLFNNNFQEIKQNLTITC